MGWREGRSSRDYVQSNSRPIVFCERRDGRDVFSNGDSHESVNLTCYNTACTGIHLSLCERSQRLFGVLGNLSLYAGNRIGEQSVYRTDTKLTACLLSSFPSFMPASTAWKPHEKMLRESTTMKQCAICPPKSVHQH